MTLNLFGDAEQGRMWREELCPGAVVLRGFAVPYETAIVAALRITQAPFRHDDHAGPRASGPVASASAPPTHAGRRSKEAYRTHRRFDRARG